MGKTFRLTVNEKSYDVEVGDLSQSPVRVSVDGEIFHVKLDNDGAGPVGSSAPVLDMANHPAVSALPTLVPVTKMNEPSRKPTTPDGKIVIAPMPGVVLAVRVKAGDHVKRGEEVCLLESMKMELNILASIDGVVKKVCVSQGDAVTHGTVLVEFA